MQAVPQQQLAASAQPRPKAVTEGGGQGAAALGLCHRMKHSPELQPKKTGGEGKKKKKVIFIRNRPFSGWLVLEGETTLGRGI